jgi:hypothetical protein
LKSSGKKEDSKTQGTNQTQTSEIRIFGQELEEASGEDSSSITASITPPNFLI